MSRKVKVSRERTPKMSTAVATLRDRSDRNKATAADVVDKIKSVVSEIPAWFWVAPAIGFFVSVASFSTGGF